MIDLHTHSSASDGTDTPEQLIKKAADQNISTIALCDHDTTSGLTEFLSHASRLNVKAVPGIEISAEWENGNCHILGLNININDSSFQRILSKFREGRDLRNYKICKKLKDLCLDVSMSEVTHFAKGEVVARPHIANVLVSKGYCQSINEAFEKYITKGAPAYVERYRLKPSEAIEELKQNGARVFLAHPAQLKLTPDALNTFVISMVHHGLDGLEVYSPYTKDEEIALYYNICKDLNLKASGGSDYHGKNKSDHVLGYYRADKKIPDIVEKAIN